MARIVGVHGIGQQVKGEHTLESVWLPALRDGMTRAGATPLPDGLLSCAFYGDLFRPAGTKAIGIPPLSHADLRDEWETALVQAIWEEAGRVDSSVPGPEAATKLRAPNVIQRAVWALCNSPFWGGVEKLLVFSLKQVRAYLHDDALRQRVRERVEAAMSDDTEVLIGHSLGSVVAYECLCANPDWPVTTFISLGSPLGIPNLVFDRLQPPPANGKGKWPGNVRRWINIADRGDLVALEKRLAPLFDSRIEDLLIHNGAKAHDVEPYLTAEETGRAIAAALTER
ncbi:MAG TPA: hypothetical protein VM118_08970 [Acidobacteriota bacterium]|nr:hypothetical protein [Acidobacteriota bacterium]